MTKFLNILKTALKIGAQAAPDVIGIWSPPIGRLVGAALSSVVQSEAIHGPGNGDKKRETALLGMQVALPVILTLIEEQTGRKLADEALMGEGVEQVQEGVVKMLNAFQVLPKKAA